MPGIAAASAYDYEAVTAARRDDWQAFPRHLLAYLLPYILLLVYPAVYLGLATVDIVFLHVPTFIGGWIAMIGVGLTVRTIEQYPPTVAEQITVADLLGDILSPLPARSIRVDGQVEKTGLNVPADAVLTDGTARIPLDYRSGLPFLDGIADQHRISDQTGEDAMVTGWALHDAWPRVDLRHVETRTDTIRGTVRIGKLVTGLLLAIVGAGILTVL